MMVMVVTAMLVRRDDDSYSPSLYLQQEGNGDLQAESREICQESLSIPACFIERKG